MKKETKDAMVLIFEKTRFRLNLLNFAYYLVTDDVYHTFDNIFCNNNEAIR